MAGKGAKASGLVTPRSPLAPAGFPDLPPVAGIRFAAAEAGVRYRGRPDVMLAEAPPGTQVAGVFTRSATRAAPVLWCEARLAEHQATAGTGGLAVIVNAGNANAFTGTNGSAGVYRTAEATGAALGLAPEQVFVASTGVIGEPLDPERIVAKLAELQQGLAPDRAHEAARAIMTTDTYAKGALAEVALGNGTARIVGIAKGSGMIAPDMATMLAFVFTDAAVPSVVLQPMLRRAADATFNCITVDGDTSTSDTVLLMATGKAGAAPIASARSAAGRAFEAALTTVMRDLAHQIVKDGEGASKFIAIEVSGAASPRAARQVGRAVANSPLVKTALGAGDPNWGRIVAAIGKAGEKADRDRIAIRFGPHPVASAGWVDPGYDEAAAAAYMRADAIKIGIDLGIGRGTATVWTCDLTERYVQINADYRS
ncbi:MAG: bifunctional glutamate N-acetyltransferase/amino-acid acetyltransferase ArgJ [Pseudomonadota bacterium]